MGWPLWPHEKRPIDDFGIDQNRYVQRVIWLGCVRKYVAMLNSPANADMLITSLSYFSALVDEVAETSVGAEYWKHMQHKVAQLEGIGGVKLRRLP